MFFSPLPGLANVPIIAVSASVIELDQAQSQRVGCDDFLSKPIEVDKVFAVLQKYLKLEWLYEAAVITNLKVDTTPLVAADAANAIPPQAELEVLYELTRLGNMERLQEYALELEQRLPQCHSFISQIYQLASNFDDARIQILLEQYLTRDVGQR
jgi:hypothetical protein